MSSTILTGTRANRIPDAKSIRNLLIGFGACAAVALGVSQISLSDEAGATQALQNEGFTLQSARQGSLFLCTNFAARSTEVTATDATGYTVKTTYCSASPSHPADFEPPLPKRMLGLGE